MLQPSHANRPFHSCSTCVPTLNLSLTSNLGRIRWHSLLDQLRAGLLPGLHQLPHKAIVLRLVSLMIPLLMSLDQSIAVQVERHLRIDGLLRTLRLEWNRRLEDVTLGQVQGDGIGLRICEDVALLGSGLGEELRHAVELRPYAINTFGDRNGIMEHCGWSVMAIGFLGRAELVEFKDIVDELLLLNTRCTRGMSAGGGCSGHCV